MVEYAIIQLIKSNSLSKADSIVSGELEWISINLSKSAVFSLQTYRKQPVASP